MARAQFQVLVFPYVVVGTAISYALFRRRKATGGYWQAIAGGGEDDEIPLEAVIREAEEEAGIREGAEFLQLASMATIPFVAISALDVYAGSLVLPEYAFAVRVAGRELAISDEHDDYRWYSYDEAQQRLRWDSNRNALWELDYRLNNHFMVSDQG